MTSTPSIAELEGWVRMHPGQSPFLPTGTVLNPPEKKAAEVSSPLDIDQKAAVIGDPIPIVFCRRNETTGAGGVLISPVATEASFSNFVTIGYLNPIYAKYHLVLSEGQLGSIQVRDMFHGACRVGSFSQTYNRRAGTWSPGNTLALITGITAIPECPNYCGNIGTYPGLTTVSYEGLFEYASDGWKKQTHFFIRNGMQLTRLVDSVYGSSSNYADLINWLYSYSAKLSADQVDSAALTTAANFLNTYGFTCDINIKDSSNLSDFIEKTAKYFLLMESRRGGKRGLRSLLPLRTDYTINTDPIQPDYTFTEANVIADTLEITYTPLAERQPFCAQMIWRQQPTDDFGIIRTSEVRYTGQAVDGPYEQHDLSMFCTSETHAVKIGAYIIACRAYVTHTARITLRPGDYSSTISTGDTVRLHLDRIAAGAVPGVHDYLYRVDAITKTLAGDLAVEMTHLPINSEGRSLVALEVTAATGTGVVLTSNKSGVGCDANSSSNTSIPAETGTTGTELDSQVELDSQQESSPEGPATPEADSLDTQEPFSIQPSEDGPYVCSTLTLAGIPPYEDEIQVEWKKDGVLMPSAANKEQLIVDATMAGHNVEVILTQGPKKYYANIDIGTPQLPASFEGIDIDMYVMGPLIGCADGECYDVIVEEFIGTFTYAQHKGLSLSSTTLGGCFGNSQGSDLSCPTATPGSPCPSYSCDGIRYAVTVTYNGSPVGLTRSFYYSAHGSAPALVAKPKSCPA